MQFKPCLAPARALLLAALLSVVLSGQCQAAQDDKPEAENLRVPDAARLASAQEYNTSAGGQTLIVMQDGKVLLEDYAGGGRANRPQMLASGSKSFVGTVAVAAVQDGLMTFDEPAADTLTEWKADPRKSQITLRQLLHLTSGLRAAGSKRTAPFRRAFPTWSEAVSAPMVSAPGERFRYGSNHLLAFGEALQRKLKAKTGETFEGYLKRRILDPIGVKVTWRHGRDGNPHLAGGAFMTARDWATFGEFVRLEGHWQGKQILDAKLLAECFVGSKANPAYGLTWWLKRPFEPDAFRANRFLGWTVGSLARASWLPDDTFMAAGAGNQRLYIIPSLKMVIVRQARFARFRDVEFLGRLLRDDQEQRTTTPGNTEGQQKP